MVDAAKIVRSPIVRAVLGSGADRRSGIEKHIESIVGVLKNSRSKLMDAGIKVAIENHAGDMQARELKMLVEAAGPDFVGVCLDSGNPVWTIEDPHLTLETLAPYVLTSHMRDSALWNTPEGAAVRWTRMGDGNMGMEDYLRTYIAEVPGQGRLARGHRQRQPARLQLPRPEVLGALQDHAGVGVRALPGALRQGQADARGAARSGHRRRRRATWPTSRRASNGRRRSWRRCKPRHTDESSFLRGRVAW